jgi:predicted aspartyl protease
MVTALLDTGATECTITPEVAVAVGFSFSGSRMLHTVGGSFASDHGQAKFSFEGQRDHLGYSRWTVESMTFVKTMAPEYQAIIGMNVITMGSLSLTAAGIEFSGPNSLHSAP